MIVLVPVIVGIVGLLLWVLASNAIVKDVGRYSFLVGLAISVWMIAGRTVDLLPG